MKKLLTTSALILALTIGAAEARDGGFRHGGMHKHIEETLAKLPEDKATLFRDAMKGVKEQNKAKWEQLRTLKDEKKAILTAPTFDKNAFLQKTGQIQAIMGEMHTARSVAFSDVLAQLTVEERTVIAEAMSHKHKRKHGGDEKPAVAE